MALTDVQKKAAERNRKKTAGLARMEVWVLPRDKDKVKKFVDKLLKGWRDTVRPGG